MARRESWARGLGSRPASDEVAQQGSIVRAISQRAHDPRGEERHEELIEMLRQILHAITRNGK